MKTKKQAAGALKLPKGFTIDPALEGKYDNDPFFKKKAEKAREILQTTKLPNL